MYKNKIIIKCNCDTYIDMVFVQLSPFQDAREKVTNHNESIASL